MRLVAVAVIAITAVVVGGWLLFQTRAPRSTVAASTTTPSAPSTAPRARAAAGPASTVEHAASAAPAEIVMPPPPPGAQPSADTAAALDRIEGLLLEGVRGCELPRGADRSGQLAVRVTVSGDRVQSIEHREGALPEPVVACVDERMRAARWPAVAAPLTLELDVRAADLR
jgi:hypothetical protein